MSKRIETLIKQATKLVNKNAELRKSIDDNAKILSATAALIVAHGGTVPDEVLHELPVILNADKQ